MGLDIGDLDYKEMLRRPSRKEAAADRERLIAKEREAGGSTTLAPEALELESIIELPSLFQPRGWSFEAWPGDSVEHVRGMALVLKGGQALDPLLVMSFGNEWYLLNGHHRLAAYREAKWVNPIPVVALHSTSSGVERVYLAEDASLAQNSKNTLNLTSREKTDAAWRAIVVRPEMSKRDTSTQYGVSTSLVANMRRVKQEHLDRGSNLSGLEDLSWRQACRGRPDVDEGEGGFEWRDRNNFALIKFLEPVFEMNVTAEELLEVFTERREGFAWEMGEAIDRWRRETNLEI